MSNNLEQGEARIIIELKAERIKVFHGETGDLLAALWDAPEGTWSDLWAALEDLGIRPASDQPQVAK